MITVSIQCGLEFPDAYEFVWKIHYLKCATYHSASVNLPGMISLLAGGGAVACAGVFVLSCRLLLDMLKVFDFTFPRKAKN